MAKDREAASVASGNGSASGSAPTAVVGSIPLGAHLVTARRGYSHHGIHVGDGRVVHYGGLSKSWRRGPVEEVTLEQFARGREVHIKPAAGARYDPQQVVARARSRLGENEYRLTRNNCEYFCEWCIFGTPRSAQVERVVAWPRQLLRRPRALVRRLAAIALTTGAPADACAA